MNLLAPFSLFAAVVVSYTGLYVFFRNSRSFLHRIFLLLCLSVAWWAFTEFEMRNAESIARSEFWLQLSSLWPFSIALLFHFAVVFTGRDRKLRPGVVSAIVYVPALLFTTSHFWLFPRSVEIAPWGWANVLKPEALHSPLIAASYGWALLTTVWALFMCFEQYRTAATVQTRKMSKHVLIGISFPIALGILTEIIFPALSVKFPELTASSATFMCLFVAYAIWRHELFALSPATAAENIISTMSDPLFLVDADHIIRTVNNAALRLLGYQEHELIGNPISKVFSSSADDETGKINYRKVLKTGQVNDVEVSFHGKDGTEIPTSLSWAVTRSRDRKVLGTTFIGRNITERRKLQESLRASRDELESRVEEQTHELKISNKMLRDEIGERMAAEERLAAEKDHLAVTLRSIGDGVITTNCNGNIALLNKAAEQMTGWNAEEAKGKSLDTVFKVIDTATGESCTDPVSLILKSDDITSLGQEILLLSRDGTRRIISDVGAPIRDKSGKVRGTVLVFRDISERKKLEDELFKTRKLESIAVLADGIAHNFNNILTGIMTNLFVARMNVSQDSETYELLSETERAAFKASSLTKQLLTFSKGAAPIRERTDLRSIIEDSAGYCLSETAVDYEVSIDNNLYHAEVDRGLVDQALSQIIRNAEQAMDGGGTLHIKAANVTIDQTSILPLKPGSYVVVTIADSGPGIQPELIQKIFDPYFTTKQDHTGLGLTTAYSIVRKHDGCIDIESVLGKGCTFRIYLPSAPEIVEKEKRERSGRAITGKGKILLMDDEDYIIRSTTKLLNHLGYEIESTSTGEEALALYQAALENNAPFDMVILDLVVSKGMGGKETMDRLREMYPDVKAFISSGYVTDPILTGYSEYGFCGAILKPYNVEELSEVIRNTIVQDS